MPLYRVYGHVIGSKYLGEVEAADASAAAEKGIELEEAYVSLCHQCADQCEDAHVENVSVELVEE